MRINLNVHSSTPNARSLSHSPSAPPPSFPQSPYPPRSLVRDERTHPHSPRFVVSHSTCPPLSPPHANIFVIGPAVIKHTHTPTLEYWVRFPNERNQGKQAHPVLKYRVPHGSQPRPGWPGPLMVGIRSSVSLVVGSCTSHPKFWVGDCVKEGGGAEGEFERERALGLLL